MEIEIDDMAGTRQGTGTQKPRESVVDVWDVRGGDQVKPETAASRPEDLREQHQDEVADQGMQRDADAVLARLCESARAQLLVQHLSEPGICREAHARRLRRAGVCRGGWRARIIWCGRGPFALP
jgi:hypothetical protein